MNNKIPKYYDMELSDVSLNSDNLVIDGSNYDVRKFSRVEMCFDKPLFVENTPKNYKIKYSRMIKFFNQYENFELCVFIKAWSRSNFLSNEDLINDFHNFSISCYKLFNEKYQFCHLKII